MDRRSFFKSMIGGAALSFAALNEANAAVYENLRQLNRQFQKSPDGVYWDAVRKHFLLKDNVVMMNNGTLGPMPEPVYNTLMNAFKVQLTAPYDCYLYLPDKKDEVRHKIADLINADPDEIAIVRNTTEGMNFFANGIEMEPGDEVLISSLEHPAGIHPWRLKEKRYGIKVTEVPIVVPVESAGNFVKAFEESITPKTKVISVSHTIYITGLIAPLKELCEMAHERNILVLADAAHGLGMLDLDMKKLGVDAWCTSPYKWFGAPAEAGVFYINKKIQDRLWPSTVTSGWDTHKSAKKFETLSQRADPLIIALGEAVEFYKHIGMARASRRINTMGSYLREELSKIKGIRLHIKNDSYLSAGLTAFSVKNVKPDHIVNYLREKYNIVIRTIGRDRDNTRGVRVSTNIFVSMKDVDQLLTGIREISGNV